jgi:hypothetical protein
MPVQVSPARPGTQPVGGAVLPSQLDRWSLVELPRLNRAIMAGALPASALVHELNRVLAEHPEPEAVPLPEARRLVVELGLAGASVARHYQEQDLARKSTPQRAFALVAVGAAHIPFREYFSRLARRTGTGHYDRDAYASLVRWNAPATEVRWHGTRIAVLPSAFQDGEIRTYTDDRGEHVFFELLKCSEALELAVNDLIEPLSAGSIDIRSPEAVQRLRTATTLLGALRQLNADFAHRPAGDGLTPDHFLDVFRQFAVHWDIGDIPPTGAQDPEFIKRDLLLGIDFPDYELLVRRIFPALLDDERIALTTLMQRPTLPALLLDAVGLDPAEVHAVGVPGLQALTRAHPSLAACHLLLQANARFAGTHLMLAKRFLFRHQHQRDEVGIPDNGLVSNRKGTTGMTENLLDRLTHARKTHPLMFLHQLSHDDLVASTGVPDDPPTVGADLGELVHFCTAGVVRRPAVTDGTGSVEHPVGVGG